MGEREKAVTKSIHYSGVRGDEARTSPMPGNVNSSRRIQQTQKSFSTLNAWRPIDSSTCWNARRRRSAGISRKTFTELRTIRRAADEANRPSRRERI